MIGLAAWLFPGSLRDRSVPQTANFPTPQLQPSPADDMAIFQTQQIQQLNSYWWIDRKAQRVHIPITQAMQDVARQGIPDWPAK